MAHPVVSVRNVFQLSECAIKKDIPKQLTPLKVYSLQKQKQYDILPIMKDAEPRGLISRRDFLKLGVWSAVGLATYGMWRFNYDTQTREKLRKMNEWEPRVANFLRETLESEKLDNLKVFTEIARPQFVDLVSRSGEALLSPISDANTSARYNLLAFALGEHYGLRMPTYDEVATVIFEDTDTLSFLGRTITRVDPQRIRDRGIENQANMWVEAVYRSNAAAWKLDPTMKDGVYLPEINQTLIGHAVAPKYRFIRLQSHP